MHKNKDIENEEEINVNIEYIKVKDQLILITQNS
jgi:hypothetical protein